MRTSLNDTAYIERYLDKGLSPDDCFWFEVQLQQDRELRIAVYLHRKLRAIVKLYGRKKMKRKLERVHRNMFSNPDKIVLREKIIHLFNKES